MTDKYSLSPSKKKCSCSKDIENLTCSTSQMWEELSLIAEDEEFLLVSSNNEELSPSELTDKKDPAKHNDGPSCSFVTTKSLNDYNAHSYETNLRAMSEQTDHPMTVVPWKSEETSSSDSSISSQTKVRDARGPGPSNKEIKESRKKDKGMYQEMFKSLCPLNAHSKFVHN